MTLKEFFEKRADSSAGGGIISGTKNAITGDETGLENAATGYFAGGWSPTYAAPERGIVPGRLSGNWGGFKNFGTGTLGISAWSGGNYIGNVVGQEAAKNYVTNPTPEAKANAQRFADQWTEGVKDPRQKELQEQDAMTASLVNHATDQLAGEMKNSGKSLGKKFWNVLVNSAKWVATRPGPIRGAAIRMGMNPEGWFDGFKFQDTAPHAPSFEAAGEKIGDDIAWLNNTVGRYATDPSYRTQVNDTAKAVYDATKPNQSSIIYYGLPYLVSRIYNTGYNAVADASQNIVEPTLRAFNMPIDWQWKKKEGVAPTFLQKSMSGWVPTNERGLRGKVLFNYMADENSPHNKASHFWGSLAAAGAHIMNTAGKGKFRAYFDSPMKNFHVDNDIVNESLNNLSADATMAVVQGGLRAPFENLPEDYKKYLATVVPYVSPAVDKYLAQGRDIADNLVDIGAIPAEKRDQVYNIWNEIKENPAKAEEFYDAALDRAKGLYQQYSTEAKDSYQQYSQDNIKNQLLNMLFGHKHQTAAVDY